MHAHRAAAMRTMAMIALALLTAACGFQLRGQAKLPFETLYVAIPEISPLGTELKRNITAGTSARLVDEPARAQAILALVSERRDKSILSFDASGRVLELQLRYSLKFRVHDARGRDYLPPSEIRLTRDISFSDAQLLSKESEELLLYRDMQSDMVRQILYRLAAAPAAPIDFDAGAKDATAR
jgi:LPS-assembly lipoprotein